jgi:hypothetical protein
MEQHSITPEALHVMLASNQEVLLFDVRQPLDLLPILKLSLVHKELRQTECAQAIRSSHAFGFFFRGISDSFSSTSATDSFRPWYLRSPIGTTRHSRLIRTWKAANERTAPALNPTDPYQLLDRRSPPTNARKHSGNSPQNTRRAVAEDQNEARYQHATTVQVRNSDAISNALQH